jgi:hypothetical protein
MKRVALGSSIVQRGWFLDRSLALESENGGPIWNDVCAHRRERGVLGSKKGAGTEAKELTRMGKEPG